MNNNSHTNTPDNDCAILAAKIIGIKECQVILLSTPGPKEPIDYYRIEIIDTPPLKKDEKVNYEGFRNYFCENYGTYKTKMMRCFFKTPYEAFYNLVKAWNVWHSLDNDIKNGYIKNALSMNFKDDTEEDVKEWEFYKNNPGLRF